MKEIYIVLTQTGTILSNIIKLITKKQYNHASISFDKNLNSLYSFGRINPYIMFIGSFVREGVNIGTFKRFKNTKCKIYKLQVTDEQYDLMIEEMVKMLEHKKEYKFNTIGLFFVWLKIKKQYPNRFYCSEFVKYILQKGKVDISKMPDIVYPEHLTLIDNIELIYEGLLREYEVLNEEVNIWETIVAGLQRKVINI